METQVRTPPDGLHAAATVCRAAFPTALRLE